MITRILPVCDLGTWRIVGNPEAEESAWDFRLARIGADRVKEYMSRDSAPIGRF